MDGSNPDHLAMSVTPILNGFPDLVWASIFTGVAAWRQRAVRNAPESTGGEAIFYRHLRSHSPSPESLPWYPGRSTAD